MTVQAAETVDVNKISNEDAVKILQEDTLPAEGYTKTPRPEPDAEVVPTPAPETTQPEKKEEKKQETPAPEPDEPFMKLERELAKPTGQEDLKTFTDREKAYFYQMRRDRTNRQKAEQELAAALFRETQLKKQAPPAAEPNKKAELLDKLKKKDPTDFLTVHEVLALMEEGTKPAAEPTPTRQDAPRGVDPVQMRYLQLCEKEARNAHSEDFDAVMELADELINNDSQRLVEVAKAAASGENPAEKIYSLIKEHPEFGNLFAAAQVRAQAKQTPKSEAPKPATAPAKTPEQIEQEAKAKKAQADLERNAGKPRTTGHVGANSDRPAGELSAESISQLSDREFAKLPKHVRDNYLKMYG